MVTYGLIRKRESAYGKALDHLRLGELQLAADNFQKAIQITPHMTNEVIKVSLQLFWYSSTMY
jgi:hypothetical protein